MSETSSKICTPGARKPLRNQTENEKNIRSSQQSFPAASYYQSNPSQRAPEDNVSLTDEDDSYDDEDAYKDEVAAVPNIDSSSTSTDTPLTMRAQRTLKSVPIARRDTGRSSKEYVSSKRMDCHGKSASSGASKSLIDSEKRTEKSSRRNTICLYFWLPLVLVAVAFIIYVFLAEGQVQDRFKNFKNDLKKISQDFPKQDTRSWSNIRAAMEDVINSPSKPWIFLLFSNEAATIACLAERLGKTFSKALRSNDSLTLKPEDMRSDYGDIIDNLKSRIKESKAVVVHDLLNIDPGAVQAFHTMCDRENPLVEEAVYILTIVTSGYNSSIKPEIFVENLLFKTFTNGVHEDKLQPLITRLTDGPIIQVVSQKVPTTCYR